MPDDGNDETGGKASSEASQRPRPRPDRRMLEMLVCPLTRGRLEYLADRRLLISRAAGLAYPIRDGIPIMIAEEGIPLDSIDERKETP